MVIADFGPVANGARYIPTVSSNPSCPLSTSFITAEVVDHFADRGKIEHRRIVDRPARAVVGELTRTTYYR